MTLDAQKFTALFERLRSIDLFGTAPPAPPWGDAEPTAAAVSKALDSGADLLPVVYAKDYVAPLQASLPRVLNALQGDATTVETLAGAVYQHADADVAPDLHRFLAVISNFYRSFLDNRKRLQAGFPLAEQDPPLAMFQHDGGNGPFTITVENIQSLTGGTVGVVSMPATYRKDPLTWLALAHETGGHDVLHADPGLLPELGTGVTELFGGGHIDPAKSITTQQLLGALWAYWIDEAASDIYGVLNIGPTFGHNLGVFFAALLAQEQPGGAPAIRTDSGPDDRGVLDPHPTDLLRLDLISGAVDSLTGLDAAVRTRYVKELRDLADLLGGGATHIGIKGIVLLDGGSGIRVDTQLPLADMQAAARKVGAYIATAPLQALDGHAIQDLETWDDADETTAQAIATALAADRSIVGAGDDAQLLAGAMLAALTDPGRYDAITDALGAALDDSYATDPIWGAPHKHLLWISGRTRFDVSFLTADAVEVL